MMIRRAFESYVIEQSADNKLLLSLYCIVCAPLGRISIAHDTPRLNTQD